MAAKKLLLESTFKLEEVCWQDIAALLKKFRYVESGDNLYSRGKRYSVYVDPVSGGWNQWDHAVDSEIAFGKTLKNLASELENTHGKR